MFVAQASTPPVQPDTLRLRGAQIADRPDALDLTPSARGMDIEFRDVTFGYREDQDILQVSAHRQQLPVISCERTRADCLQVTLPVVLLHYAAIHQRCQSC